MRLIIVLSIVVVAVSGAALPNSVEKRQAYSNNYHNDAQILRYEVDNIGVGDYGYVYEQTDGSRQEQRGEIINEGRENESLAVKGSFSWVAPDGVRYTITYTADENGYQPTLEEGPGGLPVGNALSSALG